MHIPHIRLLPHALPFLLLARFFHLHSEPSPRSRELLARWFWRRIIITGDERVQPKAGKAYLELIQQDEEQSVQALLVDLPAPTDWMERYWHSSSFELSEPSGRVAMNALLALQPRHLLTAELLEPAFLMEHPFQTFVSVQAERHSPVAASELLRTAANLLLHPPLASGTPLDALRAERTPRPAVLESHCIPPAALDKLREGNEPEFLTGRMEVLGGLILGFLHERARWNESDRPSLQSLIISDEED